MKLIRFLLLLYSLVVTAGLITIGLVNIEYNELRSILLLFPIWIYFLLLVVKTIAEYSSFRTNRRINNLIRILGIYSLLMVFLIILASLASSKSLIESSLTIIFLPLFISCWFDIFDQKTLLQYRLKKLITVAKLLRSAKSKSKVVKRVDGKVARRMDGIVEQVPEVPTLVDDQNTDPVGIDDFKRRQFLKIIGGGGVSLFLMLFVFKGNASAAFFGSGGGPGVVGLKDKSGTKIDPAEKKPTDGYAISEIDDSSLPSYYGFIHKDGSWYIAREEETGTFKYFKGSSAFGSNWANRATFGYDYFDEIF